MKGLLHKNHKSNLLADKPNVNLRRLNLNNPFKYFPQTVERLEALSFKYDGNRSINFLLSNRESIITSGYCFSYEQLYQTFYVVFDDSGLITILNKLHSQLPAWQWKCIDSEACLNTVLKDWGFSEACQ